MPERFHNEIREWFYGCFSAPTPVQTAAWEKIAEGGSVLINAPTGGGKTLSAFLCAINDMFPYAAEGTKVLYISPLKALGSDMEKNLERPLRFLNEKRAGRGLPPITTGIRTGDTTAAERRKLLRNPPNILITTPESLYIMLGSESGRRALHGVNTVIIDEIHTLMYSKRGVHLSLSLERLAETENFRRIGLSATVSDTDYAAEFLAGYENGRRRPCSIAAPHMEKPSDSRIAMPVQTFEVLPEHTVWNGIYELIYGMAKDVRTTLVFTNGRSSAEKAAYGVNLLAGEGFAKTHHGSVSLEQRRQAEKELKEGKLRCLCCTSSMELGIDVGEVDLVLQIGAPAEVAQGMQRMGRAGHSPNAVSVMRIIPRTAYELMQCALINRGIRNGELEHEKPYVNCLDVLSQQITAIAASGTYSTEELLALCRGAAPYASLSLTELRECLKLLSGDADRQAGHTVSPRIDYDRINGTVSGGEYSRMLSTMNGGTIPDRGYFGVYNDAGVKLGELDEEYVYEAHLGDRFLLGSFAWEITGILRDRVLVRQCSKTGASSPFWRGEGLGRPYETACAFGRELRRLEGLIAAGESVQGDYGLDEDAEDELFSLLRRQFDAVGCLPADGRMIFERFPDDAGEGLYIHTCFGGRVNLALALLLQYKMGRRSLPTSFMHDDDGIYVAGDGSGAEAAMRSLCAEDISLLQTILPGTALFATVYRENASRALILGMKRGGRQPLWVQRIRASKSLEEALRYKNHPIVAETLKDCIVRHADAESTEKVLHAIETGGMEFIEIKTDRPSPFTIRLRQSYEGVMMYETPAAEGSQRKEITPEMLSGALRGDLVGMASKQPAFRAENPAALHARLLLCDIAEGDEGYNASALRELCAGGRAFTPEKGLYAAAEYRELYENAFDGGSFEAKKEIMGKLLAFMAMKPSGISARYDILPEETEELLSLLISDGAAVCADGWYMGRNLYEKSLSAALGNARASAVTAPAAAYAAMLSHMHAETGPDAVEKALLRMRGHAFTMERWEKAVLPVRVSGFRPAKLDELILSGRFAYLYDGESGLIRFIPQERLSGECKEPQGLSGDETEAYRLLLAKGASFGLALNAAAGRDLSGGLISLMKKGLIMNDSLEPVRRIAADNASGKRRASYRAMLARAGRWSVLPNEKQETPDETMERCFDEYGILCRETARLSGLEWQAVRDRLRNMEYTGQLMRGYFAEGLSGAQFIRERDAAIKSRLSAPDTRPVCLPADDPALAWGGILPHKEGRGFQRVSSTAVVLIKGETALIAERHGERITKLEDGALQTLADAFLSGRLWPERKHITVKETVLSAEELAAAGFTREASVYILYKRGPGRA